MIILLCVTGILESQKVQMLRYFIIPKQCRYNLVRMLVYLPFSNDSQYRQKSYPRLFFLSINKKREDSLKPLKPKTHTETDIQ